MEDFHRRRRRFWIAQAEPAFTPISNNGSRLSISNLRHSSEIRASEATIIKPALSTGSVENSATPASNDDINLFTFRDPSATPSLRRRLPEFRDPRATLFQESPSKTPMKSTQISKNTSTEGNKVETASARRRDLNDNCIAGIEEESKKHKRHRRKKSRKLIKKAL
jgi:hypothetical protein